VRTSKISLKNANVTLTTYLLESSPEMPNTRIRPAVLICPGGAYRVCSDREAEPIAMAFLAEGYQAFILRYSLGEAAAFPQPLNDAEEALKIIRERSEEWDVAPDKVAVCGFSAGGHLAAALGTMGRIRPNAMILGYPCILESMGEILPAPIPAVDQAVDEQTPPTFIFHTYEDTLVPVGNALAMASAMEREKVPFELHVFQRGSHGLSLAKPVTSGGLRAMTDSNAERWFGLCVSWLSNVFGHFDHDLDLVLNEDFKEYSVDVQLGVLWKNPLCIKVVAERLPILQSSPQLEEAMSISLRSIIEYGGQLLSESELRELDRELKAIPMKGVTQ
jgi:acetyl esterase/lipase